MDTPHVRLDLDPAFICGIVVLVLGYILLWRIRKSKNPQSVQIFWIWLIGLIGLLSGILSQLLTMQQAFDDIAASKNIYADQVAEAISQAQNSSIRGLVVLIISLVAWGVLNAVKKRRSDLLTRENKPESPLIYTD